MNAETFATWLRRQDQLVLQTESSYWHAQGTRALQAFPYHWIIRPDRTEIHNLLTSARALALRYSTALEVPEGRISYHAVYDRPSYTIDQLGKWARKNVRKGLRRCVVEPISFARLATEGRPLHLDTLARQGRHVRESGAAWERRCFAAQDLPGFEAWAALVDGRLAASVMTFLMDDTVYMLHQQTLRKYLNLQVSNALSFYVTQTMICRPNVKRIFYGLHSLDAPPTVDQFKFRMGYDAKPVRQRVCFHPGARLFVGTFLRTGLQLAQRADPTRALWSKALGMVTFCLEGQRELHEQEWPNCLRSRREEICASVENRSV